MTRESTPIRDRIRNRMLSREQRPMKGRELIGLLTLCALILLPAVFGLWQQNDYVRTRLEIEARRTEKRALQERHRCLRIERATLASLSRIGEEGRRVGLVPREEIHAPFFIVPESGGVLRAEASPEGGAARERAALEGPVPEGASQRPTLIGAGVVPPL